MLGTMKHGTIIFIGKPEMLSGNLAGYCSRRIDDSNRLVYKITKNRIEIIQCGSHYRDK
jgi:toxin YoeB